MNLAQRLFYYLGGFAVGIILLLFFLGGKKTSCDYGPNARVLKNIRIKKRIISYEAAQSLMQMNLDTAAITTLLASGNVDFSKSNTTLDSCKTYSIHGSFETKKLEFLVQNCDSIATFQKILRLTE